MAIRCVKHSLGVRLILTKPTEGVQPGGIRSGGVFCQWTHCDHEEAGPTGPACYYPAALCKSPTSRAELLRVVLG